MKKKSTGGYQVATESIELWSEKFNRDLGGDLENSKSSASDGEQYIELNDPTFCGFDDCSGITREVQQNWVKSMS